MTARRLWPAALVCGVLLLAFGPPGPRALHALPPGIPSVPTPGGGGYRPSSPTTPRYNRPGRTYTPNRTTPYSPGRTQQPRIPGQPYRTQPGQPYRMKQPHQVQPGHQPYRSDQHYRNQAGQPGYRPGQPYQQQAGQPYQPYGPNNSPNPAGAHQYSQPSVPFSSKWFAPRAPSTKPLYHDKGRPRFNWKIHPDLRVLLVLVPAVIVVLLFMRPVVWKYVSALRQIRKEQREFLASIYKWREELSNEHSGQSGDDPRDNSQWDALIESLQSSRASTRMSAKLRMLTARTTVAYLGLLGGYIALLCGVAWGLWQLSPYSTILPNKFLDSLPWLAVMIPIVAFGGGWLLVLLYPFVIRCKDASVSIPLEPERAPHLHKLIFAVARHFNTPVPHELHLSALPTASISRRYRFLRRKWRLTLGLPFLGTLSPRQLVALLSHELTHTKQNHHLELTMRTNGAGNGFVESFNRLAWIRSMPSTPFGAFCETLILAPIFLVFKGVAYASLYLSRKLSRELEFHADRQMACLLGPDEYEEFMNKLGRSQLAMHLSFQELSEIYHLKTLPANLPQLIRHNDRTMPAQAPTALRKEERKRKTLWFDTHPTDTERTDAVKAIRPYPEPSLPKSFDDLNTDALIPDIQNAETLATIAHYRETIGEEYSPELLKPTDDIINRFKSRFDAILALNRLVGRWALPQVPIEILETSLIPDDATFQQCTAQVQAYRKWRVEHTEQLAESTDALQSIFTDGMMLYFIELLNVAVPSIHSIANKHLLMTRKRAVQAMEIHARGQVVFDLYNEQHELLNAYFQAIAQLLVRHGQELQTPNLQPLSDRYAQNMNFMKTIQGTQALLSAVRIKFGMIPEFIQLARTCRPNNVATYPNNAMPPKVRAAQDFIGFVDGRITRMLCLMGETARAALELKDLPDIAQMTPRLETLAAITFETLDDYTGDALDDAAWMLHCFGGIYRNVLSELAHVGQQVEDALGMDVSASSFASEHMQEQLAFHIV